MGKPPSPAPIFAGRRKWSRDTLPSPTSPLERSPNGWKSRDSDGVGLGIVVALENSSPGSDLAAKMVGNLNLPCGGGGGGCCKKACLFYTSPEGIGEERKYPAAEFLSSCHLCRKKLDGKDIYMYRGDKAFCSTDCRYRQIVSDEYQESCYYSAARSSEISSAAAVDYSGQRLIQTGILAA